MSRRHWRYVSVHVHRCPGGVLRSARRLQLMESTDLIPMDGDVAKITKRAEEFRELPDALQRNLQTFLTLTMDILAAVHQKAKASSLPDVTRQMVRVLAVTDTDCSLTRIGLADPCVAAQKIEVAHHLCGQPQVPAVTRRVLVSRAARC